MTEPEQPAETRPRGPGIDSTVLAHGEMRLVAYRLAPGAEIPWHMHSVVNDWYICREGRMLVETREPDSVTELAPGSMANVQARRLHRIRNVGSAVAAFTLVQGPGPYDFHPLKV
ncbi:MAG: cupin domain-containing protein [Alphaproteobacteria bacterium]|nr:cupin domain-containing protein [Alphaproteobacteria bacterium]